MIVYSSTPANNNFPLNNPQFQDWGPTNGVSNTYVYDDYYAALSGMPVPTPTIQFKILDVIDNPAYSQYSEFRLKSRATLAIGEPLFFITTASFSDIDMGFNTNVIVPITENGMVYNFTPAYTNLLAIPMGVRQYGLSRIIQGKNAANQWVDISSYYCAFRMNILSNTVFYIPNRLNFQHIQGVTPETKSFTVYGNSWKIVGNPMFTLLTVWGATTITEVTGNVNGYVNQIQTIIGTGDAEIEVTPNDFFDTVSVLDELIRTFSVFVNGPEFLEFDGFIYNQVLINDDELLVSEPRELYFEGSKGFGDPPAQYIIYKCTNPVYTIISSPWVVVNDVVIDDNGVQRTALEVTMIPNSNLDVGTYTGVVEISASIKGATVTQSTKISYKLSDFIDTPYRKQKRAFTLDNEFIKFYTQNADTYMQFDIEAKVFDFFTNAQSTFVIPQKVALFKGKAELNVGRTIHRIMKRFAEINDNEYQYKIAEVLFFCSEKKYLDDSVVRTAQSEVISFVAGLSWPDKDMTILDINLKTNRVNVNSYAFINLLLDSPGSSLQVFRNGMFYEFIDVPFSLDSIVTKKITFNDFAQGDVISYRLVNTMQNRTTIPAPIDTSMIKVFKIFAEGEFSNQIIWENEYFLKSTIDCTGEYKIQSDIDFKTQKLYAQLVEVLEILDTNKSVKLTINTGWILKTDIDTIESLMRSRRAWLEQGISQINLRPIGKTIVNDDSVRERIEYTLEFEINKKYNEETYSF